jgi:hypothetical protein
MFPMKGQPKSPGGREYCLSPNRVSWSHQFAFLRSHLRATRAPKLHNRTTKMEPNSIKTWQQQRQHKNLLLRSFFFFFFSFCLSVRGHHHHHRHHYIRKSKVFSECERTRNNTHPSHSQSLSEYDDAHFDLHQRQRVEQKKQGKRSPVWRTNRGTMTTDFMAFLTGFLSTEGGLRESWTAI